MTVENLLSPLEKVRQTGADTWTARCPAHQDKSPSLSVRELDDGRVLLHCFGGCAVDAVLAAVGLEFGNLFPEKPIDSAKPERRLFPARDVLACVALETAVVAAAACDLRRQRPLPDEDWRRLDLVATRIRQAASIAEGLHHG